jgi:2-polyprenyl-6-methoxyphenol hydroxylase-like FAD-dependent oxidoreductase
MAEEIKTITIAGGGLAGLALGIALRREGVPVVLYEALCYPRHRVCGEFISGVREETLQQLGISDLLDTAHRPQVVKWWSGDHSLGTFSLPEPAYALSRYGLDAQLCERLRVLGGEVRENSRASADPEPGTVWAAGRRPTKGHWIGLKAHVRDIALSAGLEMHLGTNGYVGLVEIEEGWSNVCGLFRVQSSIQARGPQLLLDYLRHIGLDALADRLQRASWRDDSFCAVAGFRLGMQPPRAGLAVIGDSHSIIPPFTGNGMSMALEAAALAVVPLCRYARHQEDWEATLQSLQFNAANAFHRRLTLAGTCQNLLLAPWFRRPLEILAQQQLLPFRPLFSLTRR